MLHFWRLPEIPWDLAGLPDLDTDCELLLVQIDLTGAKSLYIGAFYRPPDSDVTTLENLVQSLQRLTHRTNGNIWFGGDFNAPHINWPLLEVRPLAGTKRQIYQRLIDISLPPQYRTNHCQTNHLGETLY